MAFTFTCPSTGGDMQLKDEMRGKAFRCPLCKEVHRAPEKGSERYQTDEYGAHAKAGERPVSGEPRTYRKGRLRTGKPESRTFMQKHLAGIVVAGFVAAAVCSVLVVNYLGRKKHRELTFQTLRRAEALYEETDFPKALDQAEKVKRLYASQRGAFGQDASNSIEERVLLIEKRCGQAAKADEIVKDGFMDYSSARRSLERFLEETEGKGAEPLRRHIDSLLEDLSRRQVEEARGAILGFLDKAGCEYEKGNFAAALESAERVEEELASLPESLGEGLAGEFVPRLERFRDAVRILEKARELQEQAGANGDFEGALKGIREIAASIDGADEALKNEVGFILTQVEAKAKQAEQERREQQQQMTAVADLARLYADSSPRITFEVDSVNTANRSFVLDISGKRYGVALSNNGRALAVQVDGYWFLTSSQLSLPEAAFRHCGTLAEGMAGTGVERNSIGNPWLPMGGVPVAPGPAAIQKQNDGAYMVFMNGELYRPRRLEPAVDTQTVTRAFTGAAADLTTAILHDEPSDPQVRRVVAAVARAAYGQGQRQDFLSPFFCRRVIENGYIERHLPGFAERRGQVLSAYLQAYRRITEPIIIWEGEHLQGSVSIEGHSVWRMYDEETDTTTFAEQHPERARTALFIHTTFEGRHDIWPENTQPVKVAMVHRLVGEVAGWEPAAERFQCDETLWALSTQVAVRPDVPEYYGEPEWRFPPHVLVADKNGNGRTLVTRSGRIELPDFSDFADEKERRKAQDEYLDRCAQVLASPGDLHLFFTYFVVYVLDSPVSNKPTLLGSGRHSGDIHQDAYEFLSRRLSDRILGDCDDLAEFYQVVTRRQGKMSFVLGVPSHATCGYVEKEDGGRFRMSFVDTGAPRRFEGDSVREVVEKGLMSYDVEGTMVFDPNSVEFLFRFAGESTRTRYYLSIRMFKDPEYAEQMIRVQSYWHFNTYLTAIRTMRRMLETDKDPANCFEIAALYGRIREIDKAVRWLQTGIEALPEDDLLSRASNHMRYVWFYRSARDREKTVAALEEVASLLGRVAADSEEEEKFSRIKFEVAAGLALQGHPWRAWDLISRDVKARVGAVALAEAHGNAVLTVYHRMKRMEREGRKLSEGEASALESAAGLCREYVRSGLFREDDSFTTLLRKYASLALFYAAENGNDVVVAELLRDGPYPSQNRHHHDRSNTEEQTDWQWIRISPGAYSHFVGEFLDPEKPENEQKPGEAVALIEAAARASRHARTIGSLAHLGNLLMGMYIQRAAIVKDWSTLSQVLEFVSKSGSARLHHMAARTLGSAARFIEPGDFSTTVMSIYKRYIKPRPHYFELVYSAYDVRAYDNALATAKVAKDEFDEFPEMVQEERYLRQLISARRREEN